MKEQDVDERSMLHENTQVIMGVENVIPASGGKAKGDKKISKSITMFLKRRATHLGVHRSQKK